jgi:acyl-homoserine-lactone acylase
MITTPSRRRTAAVAASWLVAVLLLAGTPLPGQTPEAGAAERELEAHIRWTSHGIPHILGDDYADLAFGSGYAFASQNICTAADFYVTVNGERSRWFGPDGTWEFRGNGTTNNNLDSDFFYKRIIESGIVEDLVAAEPPHGPSDELRESVRAYVAGYNQWLRETGVEDISDPRCRGAEWVREIDEMDVYLRFYQLASLASQGIAIDEIGGAQPPPPGGDDGPLLDDQLDLLDELEGMFSESLGIGSNAYGLGGDVTRSGKGVVLGTPHFPWRGGERLWQSQLTIPGQVNVAGAALYGVPIILIGATEGVAWSHTVSTAFRFTPFELQLVPGSPTTYLVDGEPREMEEHELTVEVLRDDGSIEEESRTLYRTDYGPMMTGIMGLPLFPWTPARAWAMGDANEFNFRYLNHFFEKNHAQSTRELYEVQKRNLGIPWVNTIAADADGEAYYADISVVPHVTDDHAEECNTAVGRATFEALGLPVLDGARSSCEWGSDDDAPADGIFGPSNLPHLFRTDHVSNMNDSYWLTNPDEPLTGFARIIGDEETERTLRTRLGIRIILDRIAQDDEYEGEGFDRGIVTGQVFNNRQHAGELVRDDLVDMCRQMALVDPEVPDEACDALEQWDLRDDLDSGGAILFRRFWTHARDTVPNPWVNQFDQDDPVNTPNTLNTEHPEVRQSLRDAIDDLEGAGIPLDAPLRGWQWTNRGDDPIPVHGGPGTLGVFNAINVEWDSEEGYPDVPHGTSFVMVAEYGDGDCPVELSTITTYAQSEDVTSDHFNDQTRMFAEKEWNEVPFCEEDIENDPEYRLEVVRGTMPASELEVCPPPPGFRGPDPQYRDVPADAEHAASISCVSRYRIALGYGDGTYRPGVATVRDQMASFIADLIRTSGTDLDAPDGDQFDDVDGVFPRHRENINALAAAGLVRGVTEDEYRPAQRVTRAQMASFVADAIDLAHNGVLDGSAWEGVDGDDDHFDDTTGIHERHRVNINRLAAVGVVRGRADGDYHPGDDVGRGAMASFMVRAAERLHELDAWEPTGGG